MPQINIPNKDWTTKITDRKFLIIVVIAVIVAVAGVLIYYKWYKPVANQQEETLIDKQLKELEALRNESKPLSEEETKNQLDELNKTRKEVKPLSQEEIDKQLEELNNSRLQ